MDRIGKKSDVRSWIIPGAVLLLCAVSLGGCASPRTSFDWGVNDGDRAAPIPRRAPRTYAYRNKTPAKRQTAAAQPRNKPAWYTDRATVDTRDQKSASSSVRFVWPMKGKVIADYGSTTTGQRNDGINIAAVYGQPIRAAASGTITYAGNELKGYGNLILIKHDDGYVTAYAHAERLIVNRGARVAAGDVIGYAGDTGDVTAPQLHFEIRHGVRPVNPRPLLLASNS